MPPMHRIEKAADGVIKVSFTKPQLTDEVDIVGVRDAAIQEILAHDKPRLLVSFHQVSHMSSAMLSCLLAMRSKIQARHGQMRLAAIQPTLLEIFRMTNLNTIFEICDTDEAALSSFKP